MKIVIFGLSISSSWGNGHATLWRGLCRALSRLGHQLVFFERDTPYYRGARDLERPEGVELVLYPSWQAVLARASEELRVADAVIITSYCPDGATAAELLLQSERPLRVFYDLDTPVTLTALEAGERPPYLGASGLGGFDLVLSFTGGHALTLLRERLGARHVEVLYGFVDPRLHHPVPAEERFRSQLSYLGTYAADRQAKLQELFLAPAAQLPEQPFVLGGSLYPQSLSFPANVTHIAHVPPADHPAFFCSGMFTLNITRDTMARWGHCPSGRLFEAAACGAPLLSDSFEGLEHFFEPGREIQLVNDREGVLRALQGSSQNVRKQAELARRRVLAEHTAERRAQRLTQLLETAPARRADSSAGLPGAPPPALQSEPSPSPVKEV